MATELDAEGVPRTLPVSEWVVGLRLLNAAFQQSPDVFPESLEALADGWFLGLLRLSRSDASASFGASTPSKEDLAALRDWAERLPDPGYTTVLDWWFPPRSARRHAPPPLPADCRSDRPLAVLRADWRKGGDFLAVDHRSAQSEGLVELCVRGRPWIGPVWSSPSSSAAISRPRPTLWRTASNADVAEWSYRAGRARVSRTVVFLRGRSLALMAEDWEGPDDPGGWAVDLAEGVEAAPIEGSRALLMKSRRSKAAVRAIPIGLPQTQAITSPGALVAESSRLVLRESSGGRRTWRPLLLTWDSARDRKPISWRILTVTESRRVCRPDEAFAARVSWGREETLLIYRSLARPATRAFLGHQTDCRFLIALFNKEGNVEPLLRVDA